MKLRSLVSSFYSWAHTPVGDGVLCAIILFVFIIACFALLWAGWLNGFTN